MVRITAKMKLYTCKKFSGLGFFNRPLFTKKDIFFGGGRLHFIFKQKVWYIMTHILLLVNFLNIIKCNYFFGESNDEHWTFCVWNTTDSPWSTQHRQSYLLNVSSYNKSKFMVLTSQLHHHFKFYIMQFLDEFIKTNDHSNLINILRLRIAWLTIAYGFIFSNQIKHFPVLAEIIFFF